MKRKNQRPKDKSKRSRRPDKMRVLLIPTNKGVREIEVPDSRDATRLAQYWNAVHHYFQTGEGRRVHKFDAIYITDAKGKKVPLLTDLDELDRLGSAGVLSFESLY